jgi:hypothetical protein
MRLDCLAVTWERDAFVRYAIADKPVVRLLDETEDLLLLVGR